ncbi:TPA: hypothetical protein QCX99_004694 [Bacillus thuringiensis]|uniref:Lipoprotein n=1 Tax=Bacillus thuringiensis Bt18247 TaxID=1423143 RepID=A0A9W3SSB0_BACTU|nr:hypothetical protein BTI247_21820 [Bacillus thuringiensis Bt18247]ASL64596.1 hypothetical protein FORC47_1751 [Bacillus cereus]NKX13503.1 hypothetical protein [Bacillus cereus]HDR7737439.1 hypothetical protein [Bacillus thuringiensis]
MKKWVKVTLSITGGIVLLACAGGYHVYKNYFSKNLSVSYTLKIEC